MELNKLIMPLFYGGMLNRSGLRMGAVFKQKISNGTKRYHLGHSSVKPDLKYPRAAAAVFGGNSPKSVERMNVI